MLIFTFDPARALRVNDALMTDRSPDPPESVAWSIDDLILLAGVCHYRLLQRLPLNMPAWKGHTKGEHVVSVAKAVGRLSAEIHGAIEAASMFTANLRAGFSVPRDTHVVEAPNGQTVIRPAYMERRADTAV